MLAKQNRTSGQTVPSQNRDPAGAADDLPDALVLAELSSDAMIATDDGGRILFANPAAAALFGRADLLGRRVATLVVPWAANPDGTRVRATILPHMGPPIAVELAFATWNKGARRILGAVIRTVSTAVDTLAAAQDRADRAEAELQQRDRRLHELVEMLPEAIAVFDAEDRYVLWNRKYAELYPEIAPLLGAGVPFVDILRASIASGEMPERTGDPEAWLAWRMAQHGKPQSQDEQQFRDGRWVRHDERRTADGGVIGVRVDITDLKRREASLRLLFEANPVPMVLAEAEGFAIFSANEAAVERYGYDLDRFIQLTLLDLYLPAQRKTASARLLAPRDGHDDERVWAQRTAAGEEVKVLTFVRSLTHDGRQALLVALIDVTERVRSEAHITHLAHHDPLTGLANRFHFSGRLAEILGRPRPPGEAVLLLYLDLDGFKPVNDAFGHAVGDMVLQLVARLGGDEFAVILTVQSEPPETVAARLLALLSQPFEADEARVTIGVSIGVAAARDRHIDPDRLMVQADTALYRAKAAGRNRWCLFTPGMEIASTRPSDPRTGG